MSEKLFKTARVFELKKIPTTPPSKKNSGYVIDQSLEYLSVFMKNVNFSRISVLHYFLEFLVYGSVVFN